ncbi:MAG TPA: membrane protein insertase YidC [Methylomirabilota bacterium]|nr:membrane protein insertase YidC [Methylomirabilota bacterium]
MEKRVILAAMLMAGLLMVYQMFFLPPPAQTPPPAKTEAPAPAQAPPPPAGQSAPAQPSAAPTPPPVAAATPAVPDRAVRIEGPLYQGTVTNRGGQLRDWELNYRGQKPMVVPGLSEPTGLTVERAGAPAQVVTYSLASDRVDLKTAQEGEVKLTGDDGFGLRITETLRFRHDNYTLERLLRVENRHSVPQAAELVLTWRAPVEWPKERLEQFQGQHPVRVVGLFADGLHREELSKERRRLADGKWVALESEWYLAAFIPKSPGWKLAEAPANGAATVGVRATLPTLQPGQTWEGQLLLYVGPKEYDRLKAFGVSLEKSIYFGGFPLPESYGGLPMEWVTLPLLWSLQLFYRWTANYGVAIIILTVIVKALFFPLTVKSMRSMKAMQAIQPQVNQLRAKYKSDAAKLQQETMALYRQHGVNPLGGCLPMIVQIPVFYALYVALSVAVEMQNAAFICFGRAPSWLPLLGGKDLWICNLADYDPTYVLPLLMGVSMFIQQKMTPVMGDPRQAKIMLMMPIVFTFMFLNLPSGLVLYWTLSNVLQIGQQYYMDRGTAKTAKVAARAAKKA